MTVEVVNENSLLEFWMRNWLRGERVEGGENLQLDMTPHYQAILVGMYNDWLAQNRKPAEIAELHRLAGVAAGPPIPFMLRGDHPDAPRLRLVARSEAHTSDLQSLMRTPYTVSRFKYQTPTEN